MIALKFSTILSRFEIFRSFCWDQKIFNGGRVDLIISMLLFDAISNIQNKLSTYNF